MRITSPRRRTPGPPSGVDFAGAIEQGVAAPGFAEHQAGAGLHDARQFLDGAGVLEGVVEGGAGEDQVEFAGVEHGGAAGVGGDAADFHAGGAGALEAQFDGRGREIEERDAGASVAIQMPKSAGPQP